ncbi:AAA domain-containing protein [Sinomicrobium soli]|uniref:AAA domain-containing protein n=1 Tax=Sinomicrobium sp. N-1-3-6 TaxID=2219864 RepID=UPI000DCDEB6D|nr:AAA domain-containing protein [Sinomicrobium sp. N-1-3-6]RAV28090.1 hypothetical protein DN748_15435 [Sinomicrobium sp. N-1-3-6]
MNSISNWLRYYRASVIDGCRGEKGYLFPDPLQRGESGLYGLSADEAGRIWDKENVFRFGFGETQKPERQADNDIADTGNGSGTVPEHGITGINKIEIAPIFITSDIEHGGNTGKEKTYYPYWIPAYVDKTGKLYPPREQECPVFIRDYLDPNPGDRPVIASMDVLDARMGNRNFDENDWLKYWEDCERFFRDVTGKGFSDFQNGKYHMFRIAAMRESNMTRNITGLYNDLVFGSGAGKYTAVLEKVLQEKEEPRNHDLLETEIFLNGNHFGQMNGEFPLSYSQRVAFAQFTSGYTRQVFAVNGPPGTGKTTLLQSVVANLFTQSVLEGGEPPLVVGCSVNNQAITNILDSMHQEETDGVLFRRWVPGIRSFGLYMAASSRAGQGTGDYQVESSEFLNTGFVRELEDKAKVPGYERHFRSEFRTFLDMDTGIPEGKEPDMGEYLLKKIKALEARIRSISALAGKRHEVTGTLEQAGFEDVDALGEMVDKTATGIRQNEERQKLLETLRSKLMERYRRFPFYVRWLPFKRFRELRERAFKLIVHPVKDEFPEQLKWYDFHTVISGMEALELDTVREYQELENSLSGLSELKKGIEKTDRDYQDFRTGWLRAYNQKWQRLVTATGDEYENLDVLQDTAVKLDISYRNELFWLCVHFREWEYIRALKSADEADKERSESTYRRKLRRIAGVTPLFISTFHSLPRFSTYYTYRDGNRYYRELFDLMIVDEAGQVAPEVAMPSLTLAKKLLAVGDEYQIEPVWGVTRGVDYRNAGKYQLVKGEEDFGKMEQSGFTASGGSLMKMVKRATPFCFRHRNGEPEKGAYLLEHRRCADPIIQYSKDHVYKGSLKLMAGNKKHCLPPLGYIHVNGSSEKHRGSSRKNVKEALALVQWVCNNRKLLERDYGEPLDKVLAIITPFSAQRAVLKRLLKRYVNKTLADQIVVGTVHALQGAERPVILFSAVHDTRDKMLFFDYRGKFNMLNVALTRAKHSFIVFANMAVFDPGGNTPSGKLAAHLFGKEEYALDDAFIYQSEIIYAPDRVERIKTLEQHRETLRQCFETAEREIILCSPFISIRAIEADDVVRLIRNAADRGVKITVLTDKNLDVTRGGLRRNSALGREAIRATKARLMIVNGIHNKTICMDDSVIIEGSFNWLSASRDENSEGYRKDISVIIRGGKVKEEIREFRSDFNI